MWQMDTERSEALEQLGAERPDVLVQKISLFKWEQNTNQTGKENQFVIQAFSLKYTKKFLFQVRAKYKSNWQGKTYWHSDF